MNSSWLILLMGLAIGLMHLRSSTSGPETFAVSEITWPETFEGVPLHPLAPTDVEVAFSKSFPGAIAQFQWGDGQVILRHVNRPTRKLHSSATCLRAAGFDVSNSSAGNHANPTWKKYEASRNGTTFRVRERIRSQAYPDKTWSEVSQWFWDATLHPNDGPWLAVTVLEDS